MNSFISFVLSHRLVISLFALIVLGFGINSYMKLPVDAFPDISPTQVKIIMKSSGMTPSEVESRIIIPVEIAMLGIPYQTIMRSTAKYGICDISIDFEEGTDIYWARQQVNERLNAIMDELPQNLEGGLAPISSPLSEILMFTIESPSLSLIQKRSLLDWVISPKIRSVSGVAEVNALGGKVKTYEVTPIIEKMRTYGIPLERIIEVLKENNLNDGAGRVSQGAEGILVRSAGRINDINDINGLSLANVEGKIISIADVADVHIGHLARAGFSTKNGEGEVVQGLVLGLKGANTKEVLDKVKEELVQIQTSLPKGTKINIFYDRSTLVDLATGTVKKALLEGGVLIIIVLVLLLGNFASALNVSLILPFALLMSFIAMYYFGLSANLMSLGGLAIAVGILVDSAVVMVEHITSELGNEKHKHENKIDIIYNAAVDMAPSIITGVLIIIIVFMPLLTLEGLEGKLFTPVALTIVFALFSSLILALTLIPVLSSFILKVRPDKESYIIKHSLRLYKPALEFSIKHTRGVLLTVSLLFAGSLYLASQTGKAFMPTMDEGTLIVMIESLPSISLEESVAVNQKIQTKLMADIPEIASIIARTGTDELGLDPMSLNDTDTFFILKPMDEWRVQSKEWMNAQIRKSLDSLVGIEYVFTQPIEMRVSEMLTGVRGDLAIDIFGGDHNELEKIAVQIKTILEGVSGSSDVYKKRNEGIEYFELEFNQEALGYYGVSKSDISVFMKTMVTGVKVGTIQEGLRRINLMVKGEELLHTSIHSLQKLYYVLEDGTSLPLNNLVTFKKTTGPVQIEHENGYRKTVVQSNVKGRDLVSFVEEVQAEIEKQVEMPAGYYVTYGGEFENQQRAASKLMIILPISLFSIFILLFISFNSLTQAALVLINVPLALIGGFAGLYFSGEYLSVPASVGFIALLGIAVLNGVVLVNYFNYLVLNGSTILEAVKVGSMKRFRPVLMTATIAALGLLPLLFATGPGSEIQKPLAIVVINGLISSTLLTLIVLPLLYLKFVKVNENEEKKLP
ncbi:MAG: CusA/CzcA family heavy metal efflux RND transporter [Arcobacter sp.]|nr:MAG: CusA/CzcA family heavy metal efflux RND transporter [Arcobacter sp.]